MMVSLFNPWSVPGGKEVLGARSAKLPVDPNFVRGRCLVFLRSGHAQGAPKVAKSQNARGMPGHSPGNVRDPGSPKFKQANQVSPTRRPPCPFAARSVR